MPGGVDWLPGLVVLAAGLLGGYVLVRRLSAAPVVTPAVPLERRDLEARRDALVDQLRDLGPHTSAADERRRLEHEAALVLRDLDRVEAAARRGPKPAAADAASDGAAAPSPRAGLRGFLWGAGSAAAVALLILFVSRSAGPREEGGSLTGDVPGAGGAEAGVDPQLAPLEAAVQRNPDDLDARIALARAALSRQDLMTVFQQTKAVLDKQPDHAQALSYQALVRLAMNQPDLAEQMLKRALATDPDLLEGYVHMSLVHLRQGRTEEARRDIEEAARRSPEQAERLRSLWEQMSAQAQGAPGEGTAGEDTHEDVAAAGAAPGSGGAGVSGTVELGAGVTASPSAIVFVTVRPAGAAAGPPLAAKRLRASFPLAFEVGAADSMMGQSLPGTLRVDVRVDGDGDPMTRDPSDPAASADGVALGTTGLRLTLRKGP